MEGLTRLVAESLARHGFDRPLDYRRLHWSRWFRCNSHHSLLSVPSKPGVFAVAEEIIDFGNHSGYSNPKASQEKSDVDELRVGASTVVEERRFSAASGSHDSPALAAGGTSPEAESRTPETVSPRRMLAVTQFFEDDDMAFVLDRMLSRPNPMAARLASGRYFVRFVVIEDATQRRSICSALNQWMVSAAEKATGIGAHFATSLELTPATEYTPQADDRQQSLFSSEGDVPQAPSPATAGASDTLGTADAFVRPSAARQDFAGTTDTRVETGDSLVPRSEASGSRLTLAPSSPTAPQLISGAATNIHCPSPFPSGF